MFPLPRRALHQEEAGEDMSALGRDASESPASRRRGHQRAGIGLALPGEELESEAGDSVLDGGSGNEYEPGDREDFDRLYESTYRRILGTLIMLLRDLSAAEDCAQDTYLRAFRAWPRWHSDAPAEAWLHRIAINVAISYRRRERLRSAAGLLRLQRPSLPPDPIEMSNLDLLRELRALPPKQAAAVVLRYLHGYSNREIAHALAVPERTVASRLAAARQRLQSRLSEKGGAGTFVSPSVSSRSE